MENKRAKTTGERIGLSSKQNSLFFSSTTGEGMGLLDSYFQKCNRPLSVHLSLPYKTICILYEYYTTCRSHTASIPNNTLSLAGNLVYANDSEISNTEIIFGIYKIGVGYNLIIYLTENDYFRRKKSTRKETITALQTWCK